MSQEVGSDGSSPFSSSESTIGSQPQPPLLPDSGGSLASDFHFSSPSLSAKFCNRCNKTLKTKRGYIQHRALHIQKDCQVSNASSDLRVKCQNEAKSILQEILLDQTAGPLGEATRSYIQLLLECLDDYNWTNFVSIVLDYVLEIVLRRSRVLPPKQHQENLKQVCSYLAKKGERSQLYNLLNTVVSGSENVINILVYRFFTKMYDVAELEYILLLKSCFSRRVSSRPNSELKQDEKETLYYAAGSILRFYVFKGRKDDSSRIDKLRKKCIEEKLLFHDEERYSDEFLALKRWFDCLNRGGLIAVNEEFFNFLLNIENIIRIFFAGVNQLSYEGVINELFHVGNEATLNYWHCVSDRYFGESESLVFLDSVVRRYVDFSGKAEASLRKRKVDGTAAMASVAVRTNLKRNL